MSSASTRAHQASAALAAAMALSRNGSSSRNLLMQIRPGSSSAHSAEKCAAQVELRSPRIVRYTSGTSVAPKIAGIIRMRATVSRISGGNAPPASNGKDPLYPTRRPAQLSSSLAAGGCRSW